MKSTCLERRCGAVIVLNGQIIGQGFNSPPGNLRGQRRCNQDKDSLDKKITDRTCCIHAEIRAINHALKKIENLSKSIVYFASVNEKGKRLKSGKSYCTICSKIALDVGIRSWVLEHEDNTVIYSSEECNDISFRYRK